MENLGPLIGRGYVAEVFEFGEWKAIKLFLDEDSEEHAEQEAHATSVAREHGIAAPRVWDVVKANGRVGIVMERIKGESMMHWGTSFPWRIYTGAKMMARMHADMHSKTSAAMPDLRHKLRSGVENAVEVAENVRALALEQLAGLPDGKSICHGDFHPDNIMMSKAGAGDNRLAGRGEGAPFGGHCQDRGLSGVRGAAGRRYSQGCHRGGSQDIPFDISQGIFQDYGNGVGGSESVAAAGSGELHQRPVTGIP